MQCCNMLQQMPQEFLGLKKSILGVVNSYAHMPFWGLKSFFSSLRDVLRGRHSTSYLAQVCHVFDSGCWLS